MMRTKDGELGTYGRLVAVMAKRGHTYNTSSSYDQHPPPPLLSLDSGFSLLITFCISWRLSSIPVPVLAEAFGFSKAGVVVRTCMRGIEQWGNIFAANHGAGSFWNNNWGNIHDFTAIPDGKKLFITR